MIRVFKVDRRASVPASKNQCTVYAVLFLESVGKRGDGLVFIRENGCVYYIPPFSPSSLSPHPPTTHPPKHKNRDFGKGGGW